MKASAYCTVKSVDQADRIVDSLKAAGFTSNDISVLLPDKRTTKDFAHKHNTEAPEGAPAGGAAGLGVGAALGLLAGIGAIAIPGVGPFIAAGPIMALFSGLGAAAGGLVGAFVGMGIPESEAKRYESKIREGNALISVHTEDSKKCDAAKDIFKRLNADDISTGSESAV